RHERDVHVQREQSVRLHAQCVPRNVKGTLPMTIIRSLLFCTALVACGTDTATHGGADAPAQDPNILPTLHVPPPPANGIQIITPIVRGILPGQDLEMCTWTDKVLEHEIDVRDTVAVQTEPGHHVVVYYTTMKQPAGTSRPCTDTDMASFRYLSGTGGD